jgi:hypothetical protein
MGCQRKKREWGSPPDLFTQVLTRALCTRPKTLARLVSSSLKPETNEVTYGLSSKTEGENGGLGFRETEGY